MNELYYYNPIGLVQSDVDGNDINNWKRVYNFINYAVGLNDRMGLLKLPVNTKIHPQCQLPVLGGTSSMSYKDCCTAQAQKLWDLSDRLGVPLGIMWSGGIDSTRVLVSFLENYPMNELATKVKVVTSEKAKFENPEFYYKHVLPNFELVNSELSPWLFDRKLILVTGELNDQLFGSDLLRGLILTNRDIFSARIDRQTVFSYVDAKIKHTDATAVLVDAVFKSADTYGIVLEKTSDWFWWFNFCFKWQTVCFRTMALAMPRFWPSIDQEYYSNYLHHFFATDEFQLWSINNPQVRVMEKWSDYKNQAKLEIFNFDGNQDYYQNKTKRGSLVTVFNQRAVAEAIGTDFKFYDNIKLSDWYNPNNSFN